MNYGTLNFTADYVIWQELNKKGVESGSITDYTYGLCKNTEELY